MGGDDRAPAVLARRRGLTPRTDTDGSRRGPVTPQVHDRIAGIYADGWSRIVAAMIRLTGGDWDLAEECTQDAFAQALQKWPGAGVPDQPLAWLTTTARHRAIDRMRRASAEGAELREVAAREPGAAHARDREI